MKNLILNPHWRETEHGCPLYFSVKGAVLDDFYIGGYRTRSLTLPANGKTSASDRYDKPICVAGERVICWGYIIRSIHADSVHLCVEFYGKSGVPLHSARQNIARRITYQFTQQAACFPIPKGAHTARLSIEFSEMLTACTFYAPTAYFC